MTQPIETANATDAQELNDRPWSPATVDIFENEQEVLLIAELPGVKPGDVQLEVENGELRLHARSSWDAPTGEGHLNEFQLTDLRRSFRLRESVDVDHIEARLVAGLLTVRLPRLRSNVPRKIDVAVA